MRKQIGFTDISLDKFSSEKILNPTSGGDIDFVNGR